MHPDLDPALARHVRACNNAVLPGGRLPLHTGGASVGWVDEPAAEALRRAGARADEGGIEAPPEVLHRAARALAEAGAFRWRDEAFDIRAEPEAPVLLSMDRGALPAFGMRAVGVHLNGLVERADGPWLWVARRAADKLLDPGKLDHLVAGGVPAGLSPRECLDKEAAEEAGLPAALVAPATHVGIVDYAMARPEGLRRDRLHCYDLVLPEDFRPVPTDGEVQAFELWPLPDVLHAVRGTDDFKFNVNLVLIDLFRRRGLI